MHFSTRYRAKYHVQARGKVYVVRETFMAATTVTCAPCLTLDDLHSWKVSVLAQTGLSFDLSTASGKQMRTIMAGLAEFERDLIRERVKSGLVAAEAKGVALGRQVGQRPSDKKAREVLSLHSEGLSYRLIARNVGLSKNTVMEIVRREAAA